MSTAKNAFRVATYIPMFVTQGMVEAVAKDTPVTSLFRDWHDCTWKATETLYNNIFRRGNQGPKTPTNG